MYINFLDMKKSHMQLKIVEFTSLGVVAPAPIQHAPSEQSPRKKARLAAAAAAAAASSEVAHAFVGAAGAAAAPTATSTPPTPVGAPLVRPPRYWVFVALDPRIVCCTILQADSLNIKQHSILVTLCFLFTACCYVAHYGLADIAVFAFPTLGVLVSLFFTSMCLFGSVW
jgi:hypothetical protein